MPTTLETDADKLPPWLRDHPPRPWPMACPSCRRLLNGPLPDGHPAGCDCWTCAEHLPPAQRGPLLCPTCMAPITFD